MLGAAGEVGKSAKRPGKAAGKQQQQQHQQQHAPPPPPRGSDDWDDDVDDDDDEDNFLAAYFDAVVKVHCVHTEPNYSLPWQRKRQFTSTSSGFIVAGPAAGDRWLLTNAHSVDYHTQIKVKRRGDDQKFLARVLAIGVDCDMALLTVDDEAFWQGVRPLEFGPLPRLQDSVAVVGYPIGGDTISVTVGVVSRIEVTEYSHGAIDLLGVQIDAAINGGNSGGPVFNKRGQCVGIAFQGLSGSDAENVGYVIPTPVVHHVLNDYVSNGHFTGFPSLGIQWQRMESEALRKAYRMAAGQKGVLVRRVNPTSAAAEHLRAEDVLMSFNGQAIACDGTVPFRTGERIAFSYLISNKFVGESAQVVVLRDGQQQTLDIALSRPGVLMPPHLSNKAPSYFLVSGVVFTVACEPYLESEYGTTGEMPAQAGEEVVVVGQVLADEATLGYEDVSNMRVLAFNGTPVLNLQHLAQMVTACQDTHLRFDCEYYETIVLDRQQAAAGTADVLKTHSIPAAMSQDLQQALKAHLTVEFDNRGSKVMDKVFLTRTCQQVQMVGGIGQSSLVNHKSTVVYAAVGATSNGKSVLQNCQASVKSGWFRRSAPKKSLKNATDTWIPGDSVAMKKATCGSPVAGLGRKMAL
ncbi:trypsin-like cysteine/serine peptidase domain-containing protein [Scenedesmus sp. NREL 46B-D3]|nr:trypsin-like cysteine/serine peptidase domain-containing protein [Scenedesmus sp. NREL 46B-D3]